ncbi:SseB family protein [Saccharopolyspora spinosporotrichia]
MSARPPKKRCPRARIRTRPSPSCRSSRPVPPCCRRPSEEGEEQPEGTVALPVIEQEGQKYIPVFTSEEALEEAGADVSTAIRVPLAELAANWPSEDMWLAVNPASENGIGLPPDVVRMLPVFAGGASGADGEA